MALLRVIPRSMSSTWRSSHRGWPYLHQMVRSFPDNYDTLFIPNPYPSDTQELWCGVRAPSQDQARPNPGRVSRCGCRFDRQGHSASLADTMARGPRSRERSWGAHRVQPQALPHTQTLRFRTRMWRAQAPPSFLPHPPTRENTRLRRPRCRGQYKRNFDMLDWTRR